jgi:hypothetical protein
MFSKLIRLFGGPGARSTRDRPPGPRAIRFRVAREASPTQTGSGQVPIDEIDGREVHGCEVSGNEVTTQSWHSHVLADRSRVAADHHRRIVAHH